MNPSYYKHGAVFYTEEKSQYNSLIREFDEYCSIVNTPYNYIVELTEQAKERFKKYIEYYINVTGNRPPSLTLKEYIGVYGYEEGTKQYNDWNTYRYMLSNIHELCGKVRYNYYTAVEFNNIKYYPASAVIEIPNDSKVFINK